jgi:thiamine biosynthesis lipoprotein
MAYTIKSYNLLQSFIIFAFSLFCTLTFPLQTKAAEFTRTRILFENVPVSITIRAPKKQKEQAFDAMERAYGEAERIADLVSEWRPKSQTSLLNHSAGKGWKSTDPELMTLLWTAKRISEESDGAFDITFASRAGRSYEDIHLIPRLGLARLSSGTKIGVSGIAKGFIVDAMSGKLRSAGFQNYLVNAGDLYAAGRWRIRIRDPRFPSSDKSVCTFWVKDRAVSTSGQYERGLHIIDPKTHVPLPNKGSVTVVAEKSIFADAWAKAFFVSDQPMPPQEKIKVIRVSEEGKVQGCPN